jgi:hypothetical protein
LQTARDKARIVEALQSARGDTDVDGFDEMISGLDKRQFVLHNTRDPEPTVFTTRWAMSYLRGPLTRDQIADLTAGDPARTAASSERTPPPEPAPAEDESLVVPEIADGTPVRYLDPGAPWADEVGAARRGTRYEAGLAARVHLVFDEARAGVDHDEVWEAVLFPLTESPDPADAVAVDYDERDLLPEPPGAARYVLPEAPIHTKTFFTATTRAIKDHLYRHRSIEVYRNPALKLYARVGEDREAFAARCDTAAQDEADKEAAKIRDRFEGKMETLYDQIEAARLRIDELVVDVDARRQEELLSGAGTLIGVLTGRRSTRSLGSAAGKRSMTKRTEQRLRTAEAKYTDRVEDLEDLKEDLQEEILEIDAEWRAKASEIEAFEIGLEKTDISVEEVTLLWIPRD